jgi:hypothetical protein
MKKRKIYRISFHNQGSIYELHARSVMQSNMYAFIEVSDIIFGQRSSIVVDPSEERLKAEFEGVTTTYIPLQSVIRIDEVEREGSNRIIESDSRPNPVTPFPSPAPRGNRDT